MFILHSNMLSHVTPPPYTITWTYLICHMSHMYSQLIATSQFIYSFINLNMSLHYVPPLYSITRTYLIFHMSHMYSQLIATSQFIYSFINSNMSSHVPPLHTIIWTISYVICHHNNRYTYLPFEHVITCPAIGVLCSFIPGTCLHMSPTFLYSYSNILHMSHVSHVFTVNCYIDSIVNRSLRIFRASFNSGKQCVWIFIILS
jgi:hypothetical protein